MPSPFIDFWHHDAASITRRDSTQHAGDGGDITDAAATSREIADVFCRRIMDFVASRIGIPQNAPERSMTSCRMQESHDATEDTSSL